MSNINKVIYIYICIEILDRSILSAVGTKRATAQLRELTDSCECEGERSGFRVERWTG